jgi:glycine/D-amino acid oxidase-like deaminating enzyme
MALNIEELSFWERRNYFEGIDFLIVGSGIVGLSTAIALKKKYPESKILITERAYLPSGASTKNAGFACFGSPTEIIDDLKHIPESTVWDTVAKRWEGLKQLLELTGKENIGFQKNGSWDLMFPDQHALQQETSGALPYLNDEYQKITGISNVLFEDETCIKNFGFKGIHSAFYNKLEGQIDTSKLINRLNQIAIEKGILQLFGIEIQGFQTNYYNVGIQSNKGYFKVNHLLICTNGFAKKFFPKFDVNPARAQVLVTTHIPELKIEGTFHLDKGYYYFRNVDNRILIGGGRNLDFEGESTFEFGNTTLISNRLEDLLKQNILPNINFSIEYQWSGIMGIGNTKEPIVKKIDEKIGLGVRLGGMGVAIGNSVGKELADLF